MMGSANKPRLAAALALVFAVLATACAHVGREDFEAEIAALDSLRHSRLLRLRSR